MKPFSVAKMSAAVASAAAASHADMAAAQAAPPVAGTTTFTIEGGISFSNFSNSAFPAGAVPFIPQSDKFGFPLTGSTPQASGNLNPGRSTGGYGSFSVTRNMDAVNDWRFSAGAYGFRTGDRSASATQDFIAFPIFFATNSASITERDRFGLYTADFDFGRNWTQGLIKVRAFAGVRTLYTNDQFDAVFHTVGTDKTGLFSTATTITDTLSRGRSSFLGAGPRVGIDAFVGSTFGIVGNFSAALLAGSRYSNYSTSSSASVDGGTPVVTVTYNRSNENSWVGNISASLGVAWQFSPNGQLVIGYKLDQWYNVRETFNFVGFTKKEDVLIQTPFVRATLRF